MPTHLRLLLPSCRHLMTRRFGTIRSTNGVEATLDVRKLHCGRTPYKSAGALEARSYPSDPRAWQIVTISPLAYSPVGGYRSLLISNLILATPPMSQTIAPGTPLIR